MADRSWKKLSPEQQQMLREVAAEVSVVGIEKARQYETELVEKLKADHGVTVTTPDTSEFKAALVSLQGELAKELDLEGPMKAVQGQ